MGVSDVIPTEIRRDWTVRSVLADFARELQGLDEASLLVELLVSRFLGVARLELPIHYGAVLPEGCRVEFLALVGRLQWHEPLQYVLNEAHFYGQSLFVDNRVLIPRPETELLVDEVLGCLRGGRWCKAPVVVDVGTGSGCIVLSLARLFAGGVYWGIDKSAAALDVAQDNAKKLGLAKLVNWRQGELLSGWPGKADVIVGNLPYVATSDYAILPANVRLFEPEMALVGGVDGLDLVRELVWQAGEKMQAGGWLFLEIGIGQAEKVEEMLWSAGFDAVSTKKDLSHIDRIVLGKKQ